MAAPVQVFVEGHGSAEAEAGFDDRPGEGTVLGLGFALAAGTLAFLGVFPGQFAEAGENQLGGVLAFEGADAGL